MRLINLTSKGFTLIEVLISIFILSVIAVITTSFLQSTIQSKDIVFRKSQETHQFNLLSSSLQEDLMNAQNIPLTNFRGVSEGASFIGGLSEESFSFITKDVSKHIPSSSLVRVQYLLDNSSFLRRQYYAAAPSSPGEYLETTLFEDVDELNLMFSDLQPFLKTLSYEVSWHYSWPPSNALSERKIPTLMQITINKNDQSFLWVIKPIVSFKK